MQTIVVDTSIIIKWLNKDNELDTEKADTILEDVRENKVELITPELCKYEVGNVLKYGKKLSISEAYIAFRAFYSLPLTFIQESEPLAKETYEFALKYGVTYYDASFMSLAKQYDAMLITENIKHQGKSKEIQVKNLSQY